MTICGMWEAFCLSENYMEVNGSFSLPHGSFTSYMFPQQPNILEYFCQVF